MKIKRFAGWYWYITKNAKLLDRYKCGKWMYFFDDQNKAFDICKKAITENICYECKCTDLEATNSNTGVICFYSNGDDIENHYRILKFMMDNNLIRRTKTGKFYNISYKFDEQTRSGEYGQNFNGVIKLDYFIDLNTGERKF